jgi:glucose/arabinose dehydrogenase
LPRRRESHALAAYAALAFSAWGGHAVAQIGPAFVGKVTVDTGYVTGATQATDIAFSGDGRAVVTLKTGPVLVRRANGSVNTVAYPFGGTLDTDSEKGLLGVVSDPASPGTFYFYVSNGPTNDKHRVYRAALNASDGLDVHPTPIVAASLGVGPGLEGPANHDGGGMWISNGQLYIGVGDTGANNSAPTNKYGSCLNKRNGKILRVNLDGSVPADNPLVGLASVTACTSVTGGWTSAAPDQRIFAWGFRNPWRIWIDGVTGRLWVGDVGEGTQEEISAGHGDAHYGYPFEEGSQVWGSLQGQNCASMTPSRPCTPPLFSYPHSQGRSVTGGLILDSAAWVQAFGAPHYLFGDYTGNWLRALPVNAGRSGFSSTTPVDFAAYATSGPVSIRAGPDGSVYVVMVRLGGVYRFTPNAVAAAVIPTLPWLGTALLLAALALIGACRSRHGGS